MSLEPMVVMFSHGHDVGSRARQLGGSSSMRSILKVLIRMERMSMVCQGVTESSWKQDDIALSKKKLDSVEYTMMLRPQSYRSQIQ